MSAGLDRPLKEILGARMASAVEKEIGASTAGELLDWLPRSYVALGERSSLTELPVDADVSFVAEIVAVSSRRLHTRKGSITEVVVTDGETELAFSLFGHHRAHSGLEVGALGLLSGKTSLYQGRITLKSPKFAALSSEEEAERLGAVPIYPATSGLTSHAIERAVALVLASLGMPDVFGDEGPERDLPGSGAREGSVADAGLPAVDGLGTAVEDPLPADVRERQGLVGLAEAYLRVHRPRVPEDAAPGRARLRWQEAFVLQTALAQRRHAASTRLAVPRPPVPGGLLERFDAALPFSLTPGQAAAGARIAEALAGSSPLNALLQGEVGSGKTVVALRAMLHVVDAGGQAVFLAPTEVLASQHAASIRSLLGPLSEEGTVFDAGDGGVRVVCVTGSMPTAARREALLQAASGSAGIVVGTHALLSEGVTFAELGLVVVDEQHRFGVKQRDALRQSAEHPPHMLVMTATPIPRSVAMSVFGDLEILTLEGLPSGRSPIATHVVPLAEHPAWEGRIWSRAREELDRGRQVFVVAPRIGGDDTDGTGSAGSPGRAGHTAGGRGSSGRGANADEAETGSTSVEETAAWLEAERVLGPHRVGMLHGAQHPEDKAEAMRAFASGEVGALVATTVVEVGVDVPNATLMIILDAERFGISQLHQLRGRVGRGQHGGTCLLVTRLEPGHPSRERLEAVAATTDGFALAEADVRLRREGDILGTAQSGTRRTLRLLSLGRDGAIIAAARDEAVRLVGEDPELSEAPGLARLISERLGEERAAFLDRG
ncbi:ATP-dependent DNA helicase RecG [Falsarthrobacter nasiphocae]|uniref:Probable DNA 3'-5' helicase RecG n=1 Tax=Falsarthrobacter nasiphocae TaxID=189863 RepID=A0AAE3YIZ1_9MICC|nr:ATP-dependent DNA helicase RecG [Falsarthrobacter nasiphocae]MDR6892843.1 ATP-dependent DNA helicase RecG [Falsarthrobacter nasiphocae]